MLWKKYIQKQEDINHLTNATFENTPTYSLKGVRTGCKPLKVYDGDTLWIAFVQNKEVYKTKVRMAGYDSAEMRSKQAEILKKAISAKEHLTQLLGAGIIDVEFLGEDKYGRPLVKLYTNNSCINDEMIACGLGKPYDGGKKEWE